MSGLSQASLDAARQMGARAGKAFHDTGVPSRNPFRDVTRFPELAKAYDDGYFPEIKAAVPPDSDGVAS